MSHGLEEQIVIIGAGPAGLTAGLELTRAGRNVVVLESDPEYVGGIARTARYKGFRLDIGGHRFYTNIQEITDWWNDILSEEFITVRRQSRIYYRGKYLAYPLEAWDAFRKMGLWFSIQAGLSHIYRLINPIRPEHSFRDWVTNRFGDKLFKAFFETYTEKVWGIPCTEISKDWAAQRIQGLSVINILKRAFVPKGGAKGDASLKTLIDEFQYPRLGCGSMWERTTELIREGGNTVVLDRKVVKIHHEGNHVTGVDCVDGDGNRHYYKATDVLSSMPLRELIQSFEPAAPEHALKSAEKLRYRDFLTVGLLVHKKDLFPDNWIYIHEPAVKMGRIQNYKNWSPDMVPDPETTFLGLEYFCFDGDGLWNTKDEDLIALGKKEVEMVGLAKASDISDGCVIRMQKAYPIYDHNYNEGVADLRSYLNGFDNLWSVGRNGMHQYNNQDHSMMSALFAARNIMKTDDRDPWMVNHNAEYLEERKVPVKIESEALREAS